MCRHKSQTEEKDTIYITPFAINISASKSLIFTGNFLLCHFGIRAPWFICMQTPVSHLSVTGRLLFARASSVDRFCHVHNTYKMESSRRLRIIRDRGPVMQIVLVTRYTGLRHSKDLHSPAPMCQDALKLSTNAMLRKLTSSPSGKIIRACISSSFLSRDSSVHENGGREG